MLKPKQCFITITHAPITYIAILTSVGVYYSLPATGPILPRRFQCNYWRKSVVNSLFEVAVLVKVLSDATTAA